MIKLTLSYDHENKSRRFGEKTSYTAFMITRNKYFSRAKLFTLQRDFVKQNFCPYKIIFSLKVSYKEVIDDCSQCIIKTPQDKADYVRVFSFRLIRFLFLRLRINLHEEPGKKVRIRTLNVHP